MTKETRQLQGRIQTDNLIVEYQPCICSDNDASRFLHEVSEDMQIEGAVGVLKW